MITFYGGTIVYLIRFNRVYSLFLHLQYPVGCWYVEAFVVSTTGWDRTWHTSFDPDTFRLLSSEHHAQSGVLL